MTVNEILEPIKATAVCGDTDKPIEGVYVGDLLSRAMSHVKADYLFITIMANTNAVAVASLTEAAAVILAEGVALPDEGIAAANENGITVLSTPLTAYELCAILHEKLQGKTA